MQLGGSLVKNEKLRRHCANGFYRWFTKQLNRRWQKKRRKVFFIPKLLLPLQSQVKK